jgi:mono/diheme cytochrome c family protein
LNTVNAPRIAAGTLAIAVAAIAAHFHSTPIEAASRAATQAAAPDPGAASYALHCAICHGDKRQGNLPAFPPLVGVQRRLSDEQIAHLINTGKDRMPGFPDLKDPELTSLVHFLSSADSVQTGAGSGEPSSNALEAGTGLFRQNCAFCHGRDAMGGETGPDLTQSKLVLGDKTGDAIASVVREGRPAKKMPAFKFSSEEMAGLLAFIRDRVKIAAAHPGGRRGVDIADLQTGNAEAGRAYFNGAGGCSKCHSPAGDFAGLATRLEGLRLEIRMLYPWDAKSTVTVTLPSGEKIAGLLDYKDEFNIGLRDTNGTYRSWSTSRVHYSVNSPANAHVEQFPKYTDDDIHNLMAYLQTLK